VICGSVPDVEESLADNCDDQRLIDSQSLGKNGEFRQTALKINRL